MITAEVPIADTDTNTVIFIMNSINNKDINDRKKDDDINFKKMWFSINITIIKTIIINMITIGITISSNGSSSRFSKGSKRERGGREGG